MPRLSYPTRKQSRRLINFDVLVEEGVVSQQDMDLLTFTDDPQQAWETIRAFYALELE